MRAPLPFLLLLLALAPGAAQTPSELPDPSPEEIESDLTRRTREWLTWRQARSLEKKSGWRIIRKPRVIVVASKAIVGSRNVSHIAGMAELCQKWVLARFSGITREKPPLPVIRICAGAGERDSFRGPSALGAYDRRTLEIVVLHRNGPGLLATFGDVGTGLMRRALDIQSPALLSVLPDWLARGLPAHSQEASLSKRIGFFFRAPRAAWNTVMRMDASRTLIPVRDLISTAHEELAATRRNTVSECAAESHLLVRYLTFGSGRKGITRDFIRKLLAEIHVEVREHELEAWAEVMKQEALAEKRPAAQARRKTYEEHRGRMAALKGFTPEEVEKIRERALRAAFGKWKTIHWDRTDRGFRAWIRNGLR